MIWQPMYILLENQFEESDWESETVNQNHILDHFHIHSPSLTTSPHPLFLQFYSNGTIPTASVSNSTSSKTICKTDPKAVFLSSKCAALKPNHHSFFRQTIHQYGRESIFKQNSSVTHASICVGHFFKTSVSQFLPYSTNQLPIDYLYYSMGICSILGDVIIYFAVKQNGNVFVCQDSKFEIHSKPMALKQNQNTMEWIQCTPVRSKTVKASDFILINNVTIEETNKQPDFSKPFQFGYVSFNYTTMTKNQTIFGVHQFRVEIYCKIEPLHQATQRQIIQTEFLEQSAQDLERLKEENDILKERNLELELVNEETQKQLFSMKKDIWKQVQYFKEVDMVPVITLPKQVDAADEKEFVFIEEGKAPFSIPNKTHPSLSQVLNSKIFGTKSSKSSSVEKIVKHNKSSIKNSIVEYPHRSNLSHSKRIISIIVSYLAKDAHVLCKVACINRCWNRVADSDSVWRPLLNSRFPKSTAILQQQLGSGWTCKTQFNRLFVETKKKQKEQEAKLLKSLSEINENYLEEIAMVNNSLKPSNTSLASQFIGGNIKNYASTLPKEDDWEEL